MSKMRIGYLECFAGISGDMLMSALVDAGAPIGLLEQTAVSLSLGAELRVSKVIRSGIQSTKIDVLVNGGPGETAAASGPREDSHAHPHEHDASGHHHHGEDGHHHHGGYDHQHPPHSHGRSFPEIRSILLNAPLSAAVRNLSLTAFELLAKAEAGIHGKPVEEVHFHEVGAVDAIVDIVCCAAAVDAIALDRWYCSAVNAGGGFVDCAHGRFPVPAPATAALLLGMPVYSSGPQVEMVTPTGAALLRALNCRFDPAGVMRASSIGYGAGTRNPQGFPNVLRLTIGETSEAGKTEEEKITVIECAIDDLSPQILARTAQVAMERGALDVMSTPVTMKKGRLGTLLTVLCKPDDADHLEKLLFRETTTLGMRVRQESRLSLDRETVPVETEFGVIRVKVGSWQGEELNAAAEFEDCRRAADALDVPLKTVMQAALAQWRRGLEKSVARAE